MLEISNHLELAEKNDNIYYDVDNFFIIFIKIMLYTEENSKEFSDFSVLKTKNSETQVVQPVDNP